MIMIVKSESWTTFCTNIENTNETAPEEKIWLSLPTFIYKIAISRTEGGFVDTFLDVHFSESRI